MTTTADRIKQCRQQAGISQSELSSRLMVSRQAVSKWESGAGLPDVANLKSMAQLFDVSVDYLLADDSSAVPTGVAMRQPIDLASIEPYKIAGKPLGSRHHAAVVAAYPQAEAIWELGRMKRNTKPQSAIEWVLAFVTDAPFGFFGTADAVANHDAHYLVDAANRQLLVRVGAHEIESHELGEKVSGKTFTLGQDAFRRGAKVR